MSSKRFGTLPATRFLSIGGVPGDLDRVSGARRGRGLTSYPTPAVDVFWAAVERVDLAADGKAPHDGPGDQGGATCAPPRLALRPP